MKKDIDILDEELAKIETQSDEVNHGDDGNYSSVTTNLKDPIKKPKKNIIGAIGTMVIVAGVIVFMMPKPPERTESNSASVQPQPQTIEPDANNDFKPVADFSDPILEEILSDVVTESNAQVEEAEPLIPSSSLSLNNSTDFGSDWVDLSELNNGPNWDLNTDQISKSEVNTLLKNYVNREDYESLAKAYEITTRNNQSAINELTASIQALSAQLASYEKMMESVELDIMLNKERPMITGLVVVQPSVDCMECEPKASFQWQNIDVVVSQDSIFMGFKVIIVGDILKLVAGSIEHVYTPEFS